MNDTASLLDYVPNTPEIFASKFLLIFKKRRILLEKNTKILKNGVSSFYPSKTAYFADYEVILFSEYIYGVINVIYKNFWYLHTPGTCYKIWKFSIVGSKIWKFLRKTWKIRKIGKIMSMRYHSIYYSRYIWCWSIIY